MSLEKHKKPQFKSYYTPEDAYNEIFNVQDLVPKTSDVNPYEAKGNDIYFSNAIMFRYRADTNDYEYFSHPKVGGNAIFDEGEIIKPHQILNALKFNGNFEATRHFIMLNYLNIDIPYFRIGFKYFKVVDKETRYGTTVEDVILWQKEAICDDHGKKILNKIQKFNGFICKPSNKKFQQSYKGYYNMYKRFPHKPSQGDVTLTEIPAISGLMAHIFGDQQELGYQYFKVLYEEPTQKLPVLCLVSKERQTGKTTMLNFMQMLFGSNFGIINSETLTSAFNSSYAHLNIIGVDETVIDKASAVEKIKMLATADALMVNMKNVQEYPVEFFGKMVLATNKETDFMRIDNEEIRFWIRKPGTVKRTDPNLNDKLVSEIPKFLKYLEQIEMPEYKTRMVFTPEQISNKELEAIKKNSRSGLHKELHIMIKQFFFNNKNVTEFQASATDIKRQWFESNNSISAHYISRVIKDEMNEDNEGVTRYHPFNHVNGSTISGRPFTFKCNNYLNETEMKQLDNDGTTKSFINNLDDDKLVF